MNPTEIKEAIQGMPEDQRRELIKELIPQFIQQLRADAVLRDECLEMLRAKTVSQGQEIVSAATEKVTSAGRAIREKLLTR